MHKDHLSLISPVMVFEEGLTVCQMNVFISYFHHIKGSLPASVPEFTSKESQDEKDEGGNQTHRHNHPNACTTILLLLSLKCTSRSNS